MLYPYEAIAAEMGASGARTSEIEAVTKRDGSKERDMRDVAMWLEVTTDESWIVEDESACRRYTKEGYAFFSEGPHNESREVLIARTEEYRKLKKQSIFRGEGFSRRE